MADREKVINELRFQLYSKEVTDEHYPVQLSALDATAILILLKEHEPRVLTLEEVPDAVFCYLEYKAYGTIEPAIFGEADIDDTVAFTTLEDGKDYLDLSDYCKAWRCWTAMPTDEQREAAKWDE